MDEENKLKVRNNIRFLSDLSAFAREKSDKNETISLENNFFEDKDDPLYIEFQDKCSQIKSKGKQ